MGELSRYKNFILGAIIIVVFVLIFKNLHTNYIMENTKLQKKQQELERGKQTIEKWQKIKSEYSRLSRNFLQEDPLAFKKLVEEQAKKSGINIASLNISHQDKDFYVEALMTLKIDCLYKDLNRFIRSIEEKNVGVEKIRISSIERDKNIKADLNLKGIIGK